MKKVKRIIAVLLVLVMAMPAVVFANNEISVEIDGVSVNFDGQGPIVHEGRTLVPIRGVFQALGFGVEWVRETRSVVLTRTDFRLVLTLDSDTFTVNNVPHTLEVAAQAIGGSTMLPLRALLESIGYSVSWDSSARVVRVSTCDTTVTDTAEIVWSLTTCDVIQSFARAERPGGELGGAPLVRAGGPDLTIVANQSDSSLNAIQVTNRTADWQGVDILFASMVGRGMHLDVHQYTLTVTGRSLEDGNTQIRLQRNEAPWSIFATSNTAENAGDVFTATVIVDGDYIGGSNIRINSPQATAAFVIEEIRMERTIQYYHPPVIILEPHGSLGETTTEITLRLSRAAGTPLVLSDITFDPGRTGATATGLTRISDTEYRLAISGATTMGRVSAAVLNNAYIQPRWAVGVIFHNSIDNAGLTRGPTVIRDLNSPTGYTVRFVLENHTANVVALEGELMMFRMDFTGSGGTPVYGAPAGTAPRLTPHEFSTGIENGVVYGMFPARGAGTYSQAMVQVAPGLFFAELPLPGGTMKYWHSIDGVRHHDVHNPPFHSNYQTPRININQSHSTVFVPFDAERQHPWNNRDTERPIVSTAEMVETGRLLSVQFTSEFAVEDLTGPGVTFHPGMAPYIGSNYGCILVYLPPNHPAIGLSQSDRLAMDWDEVGRFPIIYVVHGHWDGPLEWMNGGAVPHIMDNLIASGDIKPSVVVSINISRLALSGRNDARRSELINTIMPLVEAQFGATTDPRYRAVGGYSMGGGFSAGVFLDNADDIFRYFGFICGGSTGETVANAANGENTHIFAAAGWFENKPFLDTIANYAPGGVAVHRAPGTHDLHNWGQVFTIWARDYLWEMEWND